MPQDKVVYKKSHISDGQVTDISVILYGGMTPGIEVFQGADYEIHIHPDDANSICGHIAAAANEARKYIKGGD